MVPSDFIYTGGARTAGGGAALPTTHPCWGQPPCATCLTEHTVGNGGNCQLRVPNLQLPKVHPLTTQVGIILGELRQKVQIRVRRENELNRLTPGDCAVSVGGGMDHGVVCLLNESYHGFAGTGTTEVDSPPTGSELGGENVTGQFGEIITQFFPSILPGDANEGRNIQAIAISDQLLSKLSARHFALVSISEGLQILLSEVLNELLNRFRIIILKQFSEDITLLRILLDQFFIALILSFQFTFCLKNSSEEISEMKATVDLITTGAALFGTGAAFGHGGDGVEQFGSFEHDVDWFVWYVKIIRGQRVSGGR